jgi:hypothetical protein
MFVNSFNLYSLAAIATKIVVDCIIAVSAINEISKHKGYRLLGYKIVFIITGFNEIKKKLFPLKVGTKIFLKTTL